MFTTIFRSVRYALRVLARAPGFSLTAIVTLALGIGAATAMFTIVNSVLLRPLPFGDAGSVVSVWTRYEASSGYEFSQFPLSGPEFFDYRSQTRALEEVAAFLRFGGTVTSDDPAANPIRVSQVASTPNLFTTLVVQPALGRTFRDGEDQPGNPCVVVLSHGLWLDAFGGDRSAIGRTARLDGTPCEIVGIMPAGFAFPDATTRLWRNVPVDPTNPANCEHRLGSAPEPQLVGGGTARARCHIRGGGSRGPHADGQLGTGLRPLPRALRVLAPLP